ncbi:MAG: hypothetical protein CME65_05860 [Halobacteriovoraceae bacterium]|nr:hypothetical protein [Halobacteriovoraceae bacterium]|tara:strand:+ start:6204 stop:7091 length:888 start_codon:yes stop_codon:yes gene_type:complete
MVRNDSWLSKFLEKEVYSQSFSLDPKANFNFRIADNTNLVSAMRTIQNRNPDLKKNMDLYLTIDEQMAKTPIWLKMENESILSLTLSDVYHFFMKYLKNTASEDYFFNSFEVSFLGPLGPYQYISLVECINEDLLGKFLLKQLLKNKIPTRALRVRTNQVVGVTFGKEQKLRSEVSIKQITDSGILFQTQDDFFINNMNSGEFLKFYVETKHFNQMRSSNFKDAVKFTDQLLYTRDEVKYFSIEETKVIKSLGYRSSVDNTYNLFCRYNHVLEGQVVEPFKEFTEQVREIFQKAV